MTLRPSSWPVRLAESLLRVVVPPETAAAVIGDLEEELARRGRRRFPQTWLAGHILRHGLAAVGLMFTRRRRLVAFSRDVRNIAGQWRRRPFSLSVAVVTLGLAMGATLTFFTLIDVLALRPRAIPRPDRLVVVSLVDSRGHSTDIPPSAFRDVAARQDVFTALCGYIGSGPMTIQINGALGQAKAAALVTADYFDVLGIHAFLGRMIEPADVGPTASNTAKVAVIGYQFWRTSLQADPNVIGRRIDIEGVPFTIVGVAPESFTGMQVETTTDLIIPASTMAALLQTRDDPEYPPLRSLLGRLRDGVTMDDARRHLQAMWPAITNSRPDVAAAATGFSFLRPRYMASLGLLTGLAIFMVLVACLNVGGLLAAATVARGPEFRVRVALGASRGDLVSQMLTESLVICVAAAVVGLALAEWAARPLLNLLWPAVDLRDVSLSIDWRLSAVALSAIAVTTLVAGLAPVWLVTAKANLAASQHLRTTSSQTSRWQQGLLVVQLALSLSLLIGAGLFVRALADVRRPIATDGSSALAAVRLRPRPGAQTRLPSAPYYRGLVDQISTLPGVTSVALAQGGPFLGLDARAPAAIALATTPPALDDEQTVVDWVSPGFFQTIGAKILRGRDFDWADQDGQRVAILSASLALRLFPRGDAVGQTLRIGSRPDHQRVQIVGIATDTDYQDIREPHARVAFLPIAQEGDGRWSSVIVRSANAAGVSGDAVRERVELLGQEYVDRINTFDHEENRALLRERLAAALGAAFATLAALLVAIGVYGRLAHEVTSRTRELGIRLALGATPRSLRALVLRSGARTAAMSVAAGLPLAIVLARFAAGAIVGLSAYDPVVFALASLALLGLVLAAAYVPARRAFAVSPMRAMRAE